MTIRRFSAMALAVAGIAFASSASAQVRTWNFGDTSPTGACTGSYGLANGAANYGNTIACSQQPNGATTTLNVTAWSSDGTNSAYRTASVNQQGVNSGFGIYNQTEGTGAGSPNHAMDNSTPGVDALLLNFTGGIGSQALKSVTLGWTGADGDFQVMRWGGAGSVTSIAGKSAATLLTDGWVLVGGVQNGLGLGDTDQVFNSFNGGNASSSSWLITAYNSAFGGSGFTSGIDAIKVLGISTGTAVSSPGTLALAALGLFGVAALRRRSV
jgi:MYXO-CTERM domain-containing protein